MIMHVHCHSYSGRHRGGRGIGGFGRGFFDGESGGWPFGMGRKLASADLQLLILALLADKPGHGYEIIKSLDERSKGFYVPSPGMVYPALTYLEEIGYAEMQAEGTRKLYRITGPGRDHLEANRPRADALLAQFASVGEHVERVRRAMRAGAGDEDSFDLGGTEGGAELMRARRELKQALAGSSAAEPAERLRIVEILKRATAEILGKSGAS